MTHLIDKDALVAEIDERIKAWKEYYDDMRNAECHELASGAYLRIDELENLKKYLNTLEVKEVDLEKELDKFYGMYRDKNGVTHDMQDNEICLDWKEGCNDFFIIEFAKHFFELGLKANNPITSADRGTAEEIIINLKKIESDYNVCLTKEIEWVRKQVGQPELRAKQG